MSVMHRDPPPLAKVHLGFCRTGSIAWRTRARDSDFRTESDGEVFVAVDEGVLVKTGADVLVSVRRALGGTDLGQLHDAVEREFFALAKDEQNVRWVMARFETGFLHRFASFQK